MYKDLDLIIQWLIQINLKYVNRRKEKSCMSLDLSYIRAVVCSRSIEIKGFYLLVSSLSSRMDSVYPSWVTTAYIIRRN